MSGRISVIGAGLAGCAAALAAAHRGVEVILYEQRPATGTPIHHTALVAELTGSADLGVEEPDRATGLLKAELRVLCPELMECADATRIGEQTLAVDRAAFTCAIAERIKDAQRISLVREEVRTLPDGPMVLAGGPATWSPLARAIHRAAKTDFCFSFIGRAPLIGAESVDASDAHWEPRYPGGEPALYLPLTAEEAEALTGALTDADRPEPPGFDDATVLADESTTVERMLSDVEDDARRLLGGPLGPSPSVEAPALCLTPDDTSRTAYHVEGFLTSLSPEDQLRALRAVDALADVQILRPGLLQRTPWLPGAEATLANLQLHRTPRVLLAGTLAGVHGYAEAMAVGAAAGVGAARLASGSEPLPPPRECLTGALCWALADREPHADGRMLRANFGMIPMHRQDQDLSKSERRERQIERALDAAERYVAAD